MVFRVLPPIILVFLFLYVLLFSRFDVELSPRRGGVEQHPAGDADLPISLWNRLDIIVHDVERKSSIAVSGGIFLYKQQARILVRLLRRYIDLRIRSSADSRDRFFPTGNRDSLPVGKNPRSADSPVDGPSFTVCETGFGAGHSSALWLSQDPRVVVVSFDYFHQPHQLAALDFLKQEFPGRLRTVPGDTCQTVREYRGRCDFLHASSFCESDAVELVQTVQDPNNTCAAVPGGFRELAPAVLSATAMNTLDNAVYFGGTGQFATLQKRGCLQRVRCFEGEPVKVQRNFVFAVNGTLAAQLFCVATTKRCTEPSGIVSANAALTSLCFRPKQIFEIVSGIARELDRGLESEFPALREHIVAT